MKTRNSWLFIFALALSSCATYPNVKFCHTAGKLMYGANCAENLTGITSEMNFEEYLKWLEAYEGNASLNEPPHGAALCTSSDDFKKIKDSMDTECRLLGPRCTKEIKQTVETMKLMEHN